MRTLKIIRDENPQSPRDWDNIGTMACCHSRYGLGDEQMDVEEIIELTEQEGLVWLPLYRLDHSGITTRTKHYACPWDSGQVGIIYAPEEIWGDSELSQEKLLEILEWEVREYDQYLTGDVWAYIITDNFGEVIESCGSYYGKKWAISEGKMAMGAGYYEMEGVA